MHAVRLPLCPAQCNFTTCVGLYHRVLFSVVGLVEYLVCRKKKFGRNERVRFGRTQKVTFGIFERFCVGIVVVSPASTYIFDHLVEVDILELSRFPCRGVGICHTSIEWC